MKKPNKFDVLSKRKCIDCGQFIKQNVIDKNPDAKRCWVCHKVKHPNPTRGARNDVFIAKQRKLINKNLSL